MGDVVVVLKHACGPQVNKQRTEITILKIIIYTKNHTELEEGTM